MVKPTKAANPGGRKKGSPRGKAIKGNTPERGISTVKTTGKGRGKKTTVTAGKKPNKEQIRFARGALKSQAGKNYLNETGRGG